MAVETSLAELRPGDHVCWSFTDDQLRARALAEYVRAGLDQRHRIVYLTDAITPQRVRDELRQHGVDVAGAVATGQLSIHSATDSYLAGGAFDPVAMLRSWQEVIAQARRDGYQGLRAVGDMSWAARAVPGAAQLPWYEAQVNRIFADGYGTAVCLYDQRLFDPARLRHITQAHPGTVGPHGAGGSLLRITRTDHPAGIRLDGEADLSNRQALATVLAHLREDTAAGASRPTVQLDGLRFADGTAARLLTDAARHDGARLVGCSTALRRLLDLVGADRHCRPST